MLRTNPKPWLVLTHFMIPAPQALCLCDFLCAICAPTPLSIPWSKQNSNFQEFNCHYGFYCWGILVTEATLHWATCWMFVNWIFSPSVFWGHLDVIIGSKWHDDRASSYESGVEFDGVKCLLNWIFFSLSVSVLGHLEGDHQRLPNGRLTKQSKSIWVKCGIQWHTLLRHAVSCWWVCPPRQTRSQSCEGQHVVATSLSIEGGG